MQGFGGTIGHTYSLVPAIAAEVPQAAVDALRNNPNVTSVDIDALVYEIDAELDAAWGVKHIGAGLVHDGGNKGFGVKVCVIDSGVDYLHPDLIGNYQSGGKNYVADPVTDDPFDDRGHGSHVAGSILADDDGGAGVVGVAPQATLLAYKILDASGQGFISDAVMALQDCAAAGGQVTNSSFGTRTDPGPMVQAAYDAAEAAGLVNVAAAGNQTFISTCRKVAFPARYSSVVAVTATDSNDEIASFSCRGNEAEIAAPGVNVNSTVPMVGNCQYCDPGGYLVLSGTSMASPHVAGVAALIIASGITGNDEVRQRLQQTADDLGTTGLDKNYGYGLVDAAEAAGPPVTLPAAPTSLMAAAASSSQIDLSWVDNSNNESNFKIERCTGSTPCAFAQIDMVGSGVTLYSDTSLTASTTYTYQVRASNTGGDSTYSNTDWATTDAPPTPPPPGSFTLDVVGYKNKGRQKADLTWSGATTANVDVYRDGYLTTTVNDEAYTDNIDRRGGGSYTYTVCEEGSTTVCSNDVTISF